MAEARGREQWEHTSSLLAHVFNLVPGRKKADAKKPADFNPYRIRDAKHEEPIRVPITALKVFCQPGLHRL